MLFEDFLTERVDFTEGNRLESSPLASKRESPDAGEEVNMCSFIHFISAGFS